MGELGISAHLCRPQKSFPFIKSILNLREDFSFFSCNSFLCLSCTFLNLQMSKFYCCKFFYILKNGKTMGQFCL